MKPFAIFSGLIVVLCAVAASAQIPSTEADAAAEANSSLAAYVYVSSAAGASYEVNAYSAASNGALTPVAGSPFPANVGYMAVNGRYLFGTDGIDIYSYSIADDGSVAEVSSTNAQQMNNPPGCGGPYAIFLDHTGANLYDEDIYGNQCANNAYQFLDINSSSGVLSYLGVTTAASPAFSVPLSFIGSNEYAYGSTCYHFVASVFGFKRKIDGTLSELKITPAIPTAPSGDFYCPYLAAADPNNHLAVSLQPLNTNSWQPAGASQLAVYTADTLGNLTTNSTSFNMPKVAVSSVTDIWMSPSGKLLAVAGTSGLQVFHFNGGRPITHYTGLLTRTEVDQVFWDNSNHLYAVSRTGGRLYVFTVTPSAYIQAPGSPYKIPNALNIIVLPKT